MWEPSPDKPGGSSLEHRQQETNVGLDSNCSILETITSQDGTIQAPGPHPSLLELRVPASGHTAKEWPAGAGSQISSQLSALEVIAQ